MNLDKARGLSRLIILISHVVQSSPFQAMELGIPTVNQSVLEENQETVRIDPNIFRSITWQAVSNSHGIYPQSCLYNTSSILSRVSDEAKYQATQGLSNTIQSLLLFVFDVMALRHGPIGSLVTIVALSINTPIQITRSVLGVTGFAGAEILGKAVKVGCPHIRENRVCPISYLIKLTECRPMYIQKCESIMHIGPDKDYYLMSNGGYTLRYITNATICFSTGGSSDVLGSHGSLYGQRMLMPFNTCVSYYIASSFIFEVIRSQAKKDQCFIELNPLFIAEGQSKNNEVVIAEVNGFPFSNLKNTWIKEQEYQYASYYASLNYVVENKETWLTVIPRADKAYFTSSQIYDSESISIEECLISPTTLYRWNKSFPHAFRFKITKVDNKISKIDLAGKGCTNFYFNRGIIRPRLDLYTKDGTLINAHRDNNIEQVLIQSNYKSLKVTEENAKYIPGLIKPWLLTYFSKNKAEVNSDEWQIDIHNVFEESDFTGPIANEVYRESVKNMIQEVKDYITGDI